MITSPELQPAEISATLFDALTDYVETLIDPYTDAPPREGFEADARDMALENIEAIIADALQKPVADLDTLIDESRAALLESFEFALEMARSASRLAS